MLFVLSIDLFESLGLPNKFLCKISLLSFTVSLNLGMFLGYFKYAFNNYFTKKCALLFVDVTS